MHDTGHGAFVIEEGSIQLGEMVVAKKNGELIVYHTELDLEAAGKGLAKLDHVLIAEKNNRFRFAAANKPGNCVDILCSPDSMKGLAGAGTIHHIAFATPGKDTQSAVRLKIVKRMLNPTPVLERSYFTSIYFREPGGVLFEVATSGPGFAIDESPDHLGEALQLPPQFEEDRAAIEHKLTPVIINEANYK